MNTLTRIHRTGAMFGEGLAGAVAIAATVTLAPALRPWYRRWGASEAEVQEELPGDSFVPQPKSALTCAITIQAPPAIVWPWLVQLGCGRGGWYSYDLLDNGGVPSAAQIIPAYQQLAVGDIVAAVPGGAFGFPVAIIAPQRVLTLAGTLDTRTNAPAHPDGPRPEAYFSGDQTFFLRALAGQATRLIFRMRVDWSPSVLNTLAYRVLLEPISFVMGRKLLCTIKQRAEAPVTDRRLFVARP